VDSHSQGPADVEHAARLRPRRTGKLGQVRLSVHWQRLLSQVDGQTPLGSLCNASTMMDYEVARFFYLMVKAGVLQVVSAGWPFIIS
jgi:hypothetical protein